MAGMRNILSLLIVVAMASSLGGCFVQTGPQRGPVVREHGHERECPPAHHWDGGECVHNGNGNGHGKGHDK